MLSRFLCTAVLSAWGLSAQGLSAPPGSAPLPPLTLAERARIYTSATVGVGSLLSSAASAAIDQWRDVPPEWGHGAAGYGRRFGYGLAGDAASHAIQFGVSALRHEDTRLLASGGLRHRPHVPGSDRSRRDDPGRIEDLRRIRQRLHCQYLVPRQTLHARRSRPARHLECRGGHGQQRFSGILARYQAQSVSPTLSANTIAVRVCGNRPAQFWGCVRCFSLRPSADGRRRRGVR